MYAEDEETENVSLITEYYAQNLNTATYSLWKKLRENEPQTQMNNTESCSHTYIHSYIHTYISIIILWFITMQKSFIPYQYHMIAKNIKAYTNIWKHNNHGSKSSC